MTVTWFDPGTTARWHYPENITFAFYQADHPWGPWSYIGEKSAGDFIADKRQRIHRWYGPSLSPKFITYNPDGSVTVILTFSGQTWEDKPESLYKNNTLPVTFYTRPQPKEAETVNDTEAQYSEGWAHRQDTTAGDFRDDAHVTTTLGAYADFKFTGRGIEILSEKNTGMGAAEVLMDGVSQGTFALYQDPMPALYQVEFYRNMTLADGPHTVRVINRSEKGKRCILDGFRVYGETDFDPRAQYRIINRANGKALGGREGTAEVGQPDQHEGTALQWKMESVGGGFYRITNIQSGKVLATSEHASLGAPVNQHAVRDDPHSQWSISAVGNATFSIINRANDMGVSSTDTSVTNSVSLAWYLGRDDQKWEIVKVR
ncbi:MAG: RICIN domain-containing protein [Puia sp.]|nr:RICIN domain-containing protein [Puia sp.]